MKKKNNKRQTVIVWPAQSTALVRRASGSIVTRQSNSVSAAARARKLERKRKKMKTGNMPPGLRRYWQGKSRKRSTSKALTRSGGTRTVTRYVKGPTRVVRLGAPPIVRRRRRGGSSSGRGGKLIPSTFRLKQHGVAALYGYTEDGTSMPQIKELMDKLPTVGKVPKEAIAALIANYFANKSPWLDAAAAALGDIAGYKLGQQKFAISGDDGDDDY
jgi:hypothetical protein